ncbi:ABC superfamily ATP binding cassette transporter substrate binding protein [Limosilactobacillus frumenti DSM 13145]|uniref:ABC superfamily ATP binding cassette transporter substrate binding protein n=1 Tax=Limosilactobacillus frumenti DSM 13145 TaxID=1423746 RepID=A0A0R1PAP3_9LACO|nr:transporter substrate-binding domain-containing protein [Limosilactobacillus frumenti]KRL27013.1 ABC superfamily ATP binding cassette transporter substrate binding protein [Limosilactobacillus frumenti DSM 13145]MBA2914190.1 transporter substrate-binding domain-containing protein [Limosilactobacillus frumenti]QFG72489.1 transporter substrate-binding domain-containing protein [Limosilactobacillus frumenti]
MKLTKLFTRLSLAGLVAATVVSAGGTVHAAKTVNVAAPNGNPAYIVNTDHGPEGYYGELIKKIDHDLPQYKFKTTFTSQNAVFSGLQSGKYDIALNNSWYNKQRFQTYYHTRAVGLDDLRLVYRKNGKKAASLNEVAKKNLKLVPVSTDDARYSVLQDYNNSHSKKVNLKAIGDQSSADALAQVANGKYDVALYPYAAYKQVANSKNGKKLTASKSIDQRSAYLLVHKSSQNKKLTKDLNKEIQKLYNDGYLEKLTKKYLYENTFALPNAKKEYNAEFNK